MATVTSSSSSADPPLACASSTSTTSSSLVLQSPLPPRPPSNMHSVPEATPEPECEIEPIIRNNNNNNLLAMPSAGPPRGIPLSKNRRSSSISNSCPICLDPMNPADYDHPLMCPTRRCTFNFCLTCIESLLSSSKDDFEEASDGNFHVKVYLNCPMCRSDLQSTICDTILLRKVDTVQHRLDVEQLTEDRLTESQQRTLRAMHDLEVQQAIDKARDNEVKFWERYNDNKCLGSSSRSNHNGAPTRRSTLKRVEEAVNESNSLTIDSSYSFESNASTANSSYDESKDEEWGVEADVLRGVHDSFRVPMDQVLSMMREESPSSESSNNKPKFPIDSTLFAGLEFFMTKSEKMQVTQFMTSGDTLQLTQAAFIMRQMDTYARKGITPQQRMIRRGSVYAIVDEAAKAHEKTSVTTPRPQGSSRTNAGARHLAAERKRMNDELQQQEQQMQLYPLPVRMPKWVELDLRDPSHRRFPLSFCDDEWDGTVLDAYSKITISGRGNNLVTSKKQTQHEGVFYVLSNGKYDGHVDYDEIRIGPPHLTRVLVASVNGDGGRQGVIKGDVVTHVDGQEFLGSTEELLALIRQKVQDAAAADTSKPKLQLVLNAEPSVAEALKRRATVMPLDDK